MASTRRTDPLRGWLQHSALFDVDHLSASDSSYTQADPTAGGVATPAAASGSTAPVRGEIEGSGDQEASVVVEVLQGGNPGLGAGMRIGYRLASEASTAVRGWEPPNVITSVSSPIYTSTAWDSVDAVVLHDGKILLGMRDSGALTLSFYQYNPTTGSWSAAFSPTALTTIGAGFALAVDSDGHIVCIAVISNALWCFKSKVPGTTASGWTQSRVSISGGSFSSDRLRLIMHPTGDWSLWSIRNGANLTVYQWASADGGSNWTLIASDTTTFEFAGDVTLMPNGRVGIALIDGTTAYWYTTGTPWRSIFTASTRVQMVTSAGEIWACSTPEGRVWAMRRSSATAELTALWSDDSGATWTEIADPLTGFADTSQYITGGKLLTALGTMYLLHQASDSVGANDPSPVLTRLGGWSTIMFPPASLTVPEQMIGSGATSSAQSATWLPVSEPDDIVNWTAVGTGGDAADSMTTAGRLQINTAAQTRYFDATTAPTTARTAATAMAQLRVTAGGSTAAVRAGFSLRLSDGVNASELQVWASTTAFAVRSISGSLATVSVDMTVDMQFRAYLTRAGYAAVYYRRPYESTWTLAYETTAIATSASATTYVRWGCVSSSTTTQEWSFFWAVCRTSAHLPGSRLANASYQSELTGKPVSLLASPLGEGAVATTNNRLLYVRAKDGPAVAGETYTIAPRYSYPIDAMMPTIDPSPRTTWRSTSTAENAIGFALDATYDTSLSRSIGLSLHNVNFPTAYLEAWDGAAWASVGTWSGILSSGLSYTRTGNVIRINGGSAATRYIWRNELVGATVDLGGGKYRKVARHTEGLWSAVAGKHVELVLEGVDGTEPASGAAMAIWERSGVLVVHGLSALYRRWRLRIPSGTTATGYYEIGTMVCGPILTFGRQHSWGWTSTAEPNALKTTTADLVQRVRRLGPVRRTWTWAWTEMLPQHALRGTSPTPDYLAHTATTEGLANMLDVPWLLQGALEELRSGEIPLVALPVIPSTSGTMITDPTQFLLGRVDSSIGFENERGDETTGEAGRVSPITIVEIV